MKNKVLLAMVTIAIAFAPTVALAEDNSLCPKIGEVAETIMRGRQNGVAMSTMMNIAEDNDVKGLVQSLIKMAFETPRYSSQEYQLEAEQDFRAKIEGICYK